MDGGDTHTRGPSIRDAAGSGAGTPRRSERGPVHPSFDFESIKAWRIGGATRSPSATDESRAGGEPRTGAFDVGGIEPDLGGTGAQQPDQVVAWESRRSIASPIRAARLTGVPASGGESESEIAARLTAAQERLKRAADVVADSPAT